MLQSEEKLDIQSMKSITTTSELDTLSEGNLTSNEMLEWGDRGRGRGRRERRI